MIRAAALILLLLGPLAYGAEDEDEPVKASSEYKVRLREKDSRLQLGLFGQISQFQRQSGALSGYNLEGMANYAITHRLAALVSVTQSLDMANGISVLFTGIRVGAGYAIFGNYIRRASELTVNNEETMRVQSVDSPMLATEVGVDQYLFNGTDRIVPATGLSLGVRYDRTFSGIRWSAMARYGSLIISQDPVTLMTLGIGALIHF